ncbi:lysozyme [Haematobacter massiliensis]|nr:lysozyme [Haematobacter massiliensis]
MEITEETLHHLKRWEGLKLTAYPDPGSKDGQPWTIGYGHTSDAFLRVYKGQTITEAQADAALRHDAQEALDAIARHVTVPLTDNQAGALVSFVFNVGEGNFAKSTLLKKLNKGDYEAVPGELAKWVYNDGKRMEGLANRRAAEAGLWARGGFVASRGVAAAKPPLSVSLTKPETLAAGGGMLTGLAGLAAGEGPVQYALAAVMVLAALTGVYLLIRKARS